ncbi:MAG: type II secretion system secretin GspD [Geminicoccaceae bacterium]
MLTRASLLGFNVVAAAVAVATSACQAPDELPPAERIEQRAAPFEPREPVMLAPPGGPAPPGAVAPVIERGTGTFVGAPGRAVSAAITRDGAGEVTLNVVDADVREVVRMVLQDALGANYVMDPAVQGTITVQTSQPVPPEDLAPILDAVLRINGAALVREGDLYKVVPIEQAMISGATPTIYPLPEAGMPGFGIQVVPLRFISAAEAARLVEPFAPPGGTIQLDPTRNLLLLAGAPAELDTLNDLVATFDVDWLAGMSFGLFPLTLATADEVVVELEELFGGVEAGPLEGMVRFLPIERLNAVLVISSQPAYLDRARTWIARLDQVGEEPQVYVYPVQNGRAADLAGVLSETFGIEAATVGPEDLLAPGLEPAGIESSGFELGESAAQAGEEQRDEDVRRPRAAAPERLGAARSGTERRSPADLASAFRGDVRIVADETTNSLVIRAAPQAYRKIESALRQLDIIPLQVLLEATIAEVALQGQLRYGVEWFFRYGDVAFNFSRLSPSPAPLDTGPNLVTPQLPGFSALFSNADVRAVFNALEEVTDLNVISSPQLLVLDNQTARLQVGDQVPIATQSAVSVLDPDAPIVNSIEQRDTGVILSVTPRVNASGLVIMEIEQEISDVVETTTSQIDSPTIRQRRVASTVAVQSGQTVVLGGLISDEVELMESGIPVLHRLPIIGPLFGVTDTVDRRNELLVVLTPRVIRSPDQARAVTEELRQRLRGLVALEERIR